MDYLTPTSFTPGTALLGGAMIGAASVMLLLLLGRIAGISGIASRLLPPWDGEELGWRLAFVAGLLLAPALVSLTGFSPVESTPNPDLAVMAGAGLLVGFGAVFGSGCTSGHGVCGLARLSPRSLVAVPVFMTTAGITFYLMRHVLGG